MSLLGWCIRCFVPFVLLVSSFLLRAHLAGPFLRARFCKRVLAGKFCKGVFVGTFLRGRSCRHAFATHFCGHVSAGAFLRARCDEHVFASGLAQIQFFPGSRADFFTCSTSCSPAPKENLASKACRNKNTRGCGIGMH